jgi:hypothetical protein
LTEEFAEDVPTTDELSTLKSIGITLEGGKFVIEQSTDVFYQCCLAFRLQYSIPTTTNSLESINGHINDLTPRNAHFWAELGRILFMFQNRFKSFFGAVRERFDGEILKMKKNMKAK